VVARPARPNRAVRRPFLLPILLAACAAPAATIAPDATMSAAPPETGTPAVSEVPGGFPATFTDDEGTDVTLDAEPQRIVSMTPAATEVLFALGIGDRVVGKVEDFALYPPEAAPVPDVAAFGSVDVEQIVGLDVDLVIAGGSNFNPPDAIARLRTLGIPVLVIYAADVETALADIALLGAATGRPDEATDIVASIQDTFDRVAAATVDLPRPRVFYELDASNGYFGPAPDSFIAEMIAIAGGEPLTSGMPGSYEIQPESIVAFDPEVILLGDAAYGVTVEQVGARAGWSGLTAVVEGAIRPVDDVVITRPGPRLGTGLLSLVQAIHPDLVLP
jgi:iron complex transport system substrate-binding protein